MSGTTCKVCGDYDCRLHFSRRPPASGEPSTEAANWGVAWAEEGVEALRADLATCSMDMLDIVARWMLEHGWTEPLDSEDRATPPSLDVPTLAESIDFHIETSWPRDTACDGTCAEDIAEHYASRLTRRSRP